MDLSQLRQFQKVAELEHITKASLELRVAQPALSKTIHNMERELGADLFVREKKSIRLNQQGRILLRYAREIAEECEILTQELQDNVKQQSQVLSLYFKAPAVFLSPYLKQFLDGCPHARFDLTFVGKGYPEDELLYDFILDTWVPGEETEHELHLKTEEMFLLVPETNPLAERESIFLEEAKEEGFICFPRGTGPNRMLVEYCRMAGFEPKQLLESDDYFTISRLVESGMGVALVPSGIWGLRYQKHARTLRITAPVCVNALRLRWQPRKKKKKVCREFLEFVQHAGLLEGSPQ